MEQAYTFLVCIFSVLFLIITIRRTQARKHNLPPGPTGIPILGSLLQLGSNPHQTMYHFAKQYGPLMSIRLGSVTTIVASSALVAKDMLHKHDQSISDRYVPDVATVQPNYQHNLSLAKGNPAWRNRRRISITRLFSSTSLDSLQHLRHMKIQQLISHIRTSISSGGGAVDIGKLAFATSLNSISNTILSQDIVDTDFDSAQEFKDLVWGIMEDSGKPNISDFFPFLRRFDLQGLKRHLFPSYVRLHQILDNIIGQRIKLRKSPNYQSVDFLDVLLQYCEQDDKIFTVQRIKPLILDLFIGGSDTSAGTVEWAFAELLRNPKMLAKARNELTQVIGNNNTVKETDLKNLPYIDAVVKETLRLHMAAPFLLPYQSTKEVEISDGGGGSYTVPKDTRVLINAWAISRDPASWDDPLTFSPERFTNDSNQSKLDYIGQDFEFLPFGAGRRICPGVPLAIRMVGLEIASLLHCFDWKLPEGTTPDNLDMGEQFGVTLKRAVPLLAIPIP